MAIQKADKILNSSLVHLHQRQVHSKVIYSIMLLATIFVLGALPFLYISISIRGTGLIKSSQNITELLVPVSGRVLSVNVTENQKVTKGVTLLTIDGTLTKQQSILLRKHYVQLNQQLMDAEALIKRVNKKMKIRNYTPITRLYVSSWQQYIVQFQNATNAKLHAEQIYLRYHSLYKKNVVTKAEFEQHEFNYVQAVSDLHIINKKYENQWQSEAYQYQKQLNDLQNQKVQLNEQEKQHHLKATIAGSIQNLTGIQNGTYVYANQKIGEISPDGTLFAYCYVKPSDIGLIKKGQQVHLQIEAFNYNEWGRLMAKVVDIADDITIQNQSPYFKIKCQLNKPYLKLKSGYKGFIRKGMTFNANFSITRRSLYQLLYDKVNDWVN